MTLKVIEPIQKHLKEFKTKQDFEEYFKHHQDELNQMTTQKLNKLFAITEVNDNGDEVVYRITKIKGEICVKRVPNKKPVTDSEDGNEEMQNINNRLSALENYVKQLSETINKLISEFNKGKG